MEVILVGLIAFGIGAIVGIFIKHIGKCLCC